MIRIAGLGVTYPAEPIVAAETAASITHGDLTALLFSQELKWRGSPGESRDWAPLTTAAALPLP